MHLVLDTANGTTVANETVLMQIGALQENIEPHLLEDTPDVMTVGRRCQEHGYGFAWDPFSDQPYYTKPDGKGGWNGDVVPLYAFDYCPYLPDFDNEVCESTNDPYAMAMPAVGTEGAVAAPGTSKDTGADHGIAEAQAAIVEAESVIGQLLGTYEGVRPADHWNLEAGGDDWIRVHEKRRKALFTPDGVRGAPDVGTLTETRVTYLKFDDGEIAKITDDWTDPANAHRVLDKSWQGVSVFYVGAKACIDVEQEVDEFFDRLEGEVESPHKPGDWVTQEDLMRLATTAAHLFSHRVFNPLLQALLPLPCAAKASQQGYP